MCTILWQNKDIKLADFSMWLKVYLVIFIDIGQMECGRRYIDLTHPITEHVLTWPIMPKFNFTNLYASDKLGFWNEFNSFQISEHAGTHMDSPAHVVRNGKYLDEISLKSLVGPGVVIDIVSRAAANRDTTIDVQDLLNWEETYGRIPSGAFVFLNSGWTNKYPNCTDVFGVDNTVMVNIDNAHFPTFTVASSKWLINNRNINGIGTDTPSPDLDPTFQVHRVILGADKVILENVANLHKIPPSATTIYALPISLHRGTGGPMRLFATLGDDDGDMPSNAQRHLSKLPSIIIVSLCLHLYLTQ